MSAPAAVDPDGAAQRALRFLQARGTPRLRLAAEAAAGQGDAEALARALAADQDARGAIAAEGGGGARASVASTADALELLDLVGSLDRPVVERAAAFLESAQREDGSFAAAEDAGEEQVLARTAAVLCVLARTPFARTRALHAGEAWLRARWSVERVQGSSYAPILAYFQVLAQVSSEIADEALQWCGRELERGFRQGAFSALDVARVFLRCGARALPGTRIAASEVVEALVRAQGEDGAFEAGREAAQAESEAPAARARATLLALVALRRLGL